MQCEVLTIDNAGDRIRNRVLSVMPDAADDLQSLLATEAAMASGGLVIVHDRGDDFLVNTYSNPPRDLLETVERNARRVWRDQQSRPEP